MAVTIYVKDGCRYCDALKQRLDARGTEYTEMNVLEQREVIPEMLKLTGGRRVVPVLVDGTRVEVAPEGGESF
jgi:glutaredoxin